MDDFYAICRADGDTVTEYDRWLEADGPDDWSRAEDAAEGTIEAEYQMVLMRPTVVGTRRIGYEISAGDYEADHE